jgi:hypothetical protein
MEALESASGAPADVCAARCTQPPSSFCSSAPISTFFCGGTRLESAHAAFDSFKVAALVLTALKALLKAVFSGNEVRSATLGTNDQNRCSQPSIVELGLLFIGAVVDSALIMYARHILRSLSVACQKD